MAENTPHGWICPSARPALALGSLDRDHSGMARDHTIQTRDHIVRLAYYSGHKSYEPIWEHPANAPLREQRPDPGVLGIGDQVHVPDAPPWRFERLPTRREHQLVLDLPHPHVRLRLLRAGFVPFGGVAVRDRFDDELQTATPDGDGQFELELGPDTVFVTLGAELQEVELDVAALQPLDTLAGVHARLENLGYEPGSLGPTGPDDAYGFRMAVEEFQCDHGQVVDGVVGPNTLAMLAGVHGA